MINEDYLIKFLKSEHSEIYEDTEIWKLQDELIKKLVELQRLKELYLDCSESMQNLFRYFEDIK